MEIKTHRRIDQRLCGTPVELGDGFAAVEMKTLEEMAADEKRLVHGGFIFGQADYAAMLAVNHPNVVLGGASVRFLKPVRVGDTLLALARVEEQEGKKVTVSVSVKRGEEEVFVGTFTCFVLERHVLDRV